MAAVFTNKDSLLRQVGMVTVYYHLFRLARNDGWISQITRKKLVDFDKRREANAKLAEENLAKADYDLIEFDRYAQSPNDAGALKFRLRVMLERVFNRKVQTDDLPTPLLSNTMLSLAMRQTRRCVDRVLVSQSPSPGTPYSFDLRTPAGLWRFRRIARSSTPSRQTFGRARALTHTRWNFRCRPMRQGIW